MDRHTPAPDDAELPALLAELAERARHVDVDIRREAFARLNDLASNVHGRAAAAIPCLVEGLADADPQIGDSALWALKHCAPDSLHALVACLSHPAAYVRERAAHSLGNIGDGARDAAAPGVREMLADADQAARQRAAWALGLMHDTCHDTVQPLVAMIANGTPADASSALHALGNLGRSAGRDFLAPYGAQILGCLDSPDTEVRRWALYAADTIGLGAQTWADTLVRVVRQDDSSAVRTAALSTLKGLASSVDLASAVPDLITRLTEPGREASLACEILGTMRPQATAAVGALQAMLTSDDWVLSAATALWRIEGRAESIIPSMARVFEQQGEGVCDLICELGPAASPLIPAVVASLAQEDWDLQWAAADALRAMASSDPVVLRSLLDTLTHPSPIVRSAVARALTAVGSPAVRPLMALLLDPANPCATLAARALGDMGSVAAESVPTLRASMVSGSEPLAGCCAVALASIAADIAALPFLIATLRSDDPAAPREAAARALGGLGPGARDAAQALGALLNDDDIDVADAAMQALVAIRAVPH